jgi:hypothetical protein
MKSREKCREETEKNGKAHRTLRVFGLDCGRSGKTATTSAHSSRTVFQIPQKFDGDAERGQPRGDESPAVCRRRWGANAEYGGTRLLNGSGHGKEMSADADQRRLLLDGSQQIQQLGARGRLSEAIRKV